MMVHEERKHSVLSPSGASRWLACTPSALLERQFLDTTSDAAKEGTLAHELAEMKIRNYFYTVEFGKRKLTAAINKLKKEVLWKDEMLGYTDEYLDYVKSIAMKFENQPTVKIEARVSLDAYVPHLSDEDAASGSADCILIGGGILHVIDFKYGKSPEGRVEAEGNPQLALYALGAYEAYKILYPIATIRMSIVQPRLQDGVSEWECPVMELLAFGKYVKGRADLAIKGEGDFSPGEKTCRYCRARGKCRARADENVKLAFAVGKKPPLISNEEMGQYLETGSGVAKWLSELQDTALKECLDGRDVPGWKAVEGRGNRIWTDLDTAFAALEASGMEEAILWERKPVTPPALEKILGKKEFEVQALEYVTKTKGKPTLVKDSDSREAVTNKVTAEEAFGGEAS